MADPNVNTGTLVWLGGYDLSAALRQVDIKATRAAKANSRFSVDGMETFYPGIMSVDAMLNGYFAAGAGQPDAVTAPRLFGASPDFTEWPLTVLPTNAPGAAAGADGNVAWNLRTCQFGIKFGAPHGDLLPFYLTSRAKTGLLDRMTVMLPQATRSGTVQGTPYQLGAVTSGTNKIVATLHVFSVTGGAGSVTVTIESDTVGFPSPITRGTFNAVATAAGVGRQTIEITSTITDDYWRAVATWTPGTNYSLAVCAALTPV